MKIQTLHKNILLWLILSLSFFQLNAQQTFPERFVFDRRIRNWIVHLPKDYDNTKQYPLFVNMHGFTSNGNQQMSYSAFNDLSDEKGCIVVYPDGINKRWNSGETFGIETNVDDAGFIARLIDRMILVYNADPNRIYSTGYSAGGFMSYKMACERTNRVAAIAPVVGSVNNSTYAVCSPLRPIPIIAFNGTEDALTAYNGFTGQFPSIAEIMEFWRNKNSCDITPDTTNLPNINTTDKTTVSKIEFKNCAEGVQQILMRVNGGGHTWPGSDLPGVGNTTKDISANQEMWNFCTQFTIPENVRCAAPSNLNALPSSGPGSVFFFTWDEVADAEFYTFALINEKDSIVFTDSLKTTGFSSEVPTPTNYRWSVSSQCKSGYVAWSEVQLVEPTTTGILNKNDIRLNIFPNPTNHNIRISGLKGYSVIPVQVLDIQGRICKTLMITSSLNVEIDISALASGTYFINAGNATGSFVKMP